MENNLTYMLAAPALALLAIIPAFLFAARQARKTRQKKEVEAYNAEVEKKRTAKKDGRRRGEIKSV